MGSEIIDVIDMHNFSQKDVAKDKETKDLLKFLLRSRRVMKITKRELKAWCLKGIEELEEIGKTSKEIREQNGVDRFDVDPNASAMEDETAEYSHEIPAKPSAERKFRVFMDVSNFKRENMVVEVHGNQLVVEAEHGIQTDEHGIISRKFIRKFDIPEEVDAETLRSFIDVYSVLIVEGSFKPQEVEENSREIVVLKDSCGQDGPQPFRDLKQFQELAVYHQKDFKNMTNIAENLADQLDSREIPIETA